MERVGSVPAAACRNSSANSNVPVDRHSRTIPRMKPTSPSRVIQNAFRAARAAAGRSYQKPISR